MAVTDIVAADIDKAACRVLRYHTARPTVLHCDIRELEPQRSSGPLARPS